MTFTADDQWLRVEGRAGIVCHTLAALPTLGRQVHLNTDIILTSCSSTVIVDCGFQGFSTRERG